jgi:hypothetical protein
MGLLMLFFRDKVKQLFSSMPPLIYSVSYLAHISHLEMRRELHGLYPVSWASLRLKEVKDKHLKK